MMRNFEKYTANVMDTLDTPYDYGSVMHYHKLAFSRNGSPTIVPLKKDAEIGQRLKLSDIDAEKVNILYKCREEVAVGRSSSSPTTLSTTTSAAISGVLSETVRFTVASTMESTMPSLTANFETTEGLTNPTSNPSLTAYTLKQKSCNDSNDHCRMWSNIGHCKWSYKYMYNYCKKSCNLCDSRGIMENFPCKYETQLEPQFSDPVETTARPTLTSGQQSCEDKNLFCSYWARNGQCQSETKFMHKICRKACNLCENW
uniref:Metalloendopeptidase n=1 Tax=Romanomermis culicivorax TaxID=13658 RepID=A0A915L804_ROMCU